MTNNSQKQRKTFRQPRNQDDSRYLEPIINPDGSFFCCGCLEHKTTDDISADPRYCHDCYDFLKKEAGLIPYSKKKPHWIPGNFVMPRESTSAKISPLKTPTIAGYSRGILATVNRPEIRVAKNQPQVGKVTSEKRGRPLIELPEAKILAMAKQGMGSKAIAARLAEQGINAKFRTIARILAGQRVIGANI